MIPQTDLGWQEQSWQDVLRHAVTDPGELLRILQLEPDQLSLSEQGSAQFPLRVPQSFIARMRRGDPDDPLLRQVLNLEGESLSHPDFSPDPLEESTQNPVPGLIHKYRNRALVTLSGSCAVHCRYCFRRHFDYRANTPGRRGWSEITQYLRGHPEIDEIILSGGDPLSAPDDLIHQFAREIRDDTEVQRLRVHTRLPVVIPQRILPSCGDWLGVFDNTPVVLHINHANEIDASLERAVQRLADMGARLFNQAVMLRGVNDSVEAQLALHRRCFDIGMQPYYLHMLDRVSGASHYEVPAGEVLAIYEELRARISGYMLPRLVRENAGDIAKSPVHT